MRRVAALAAMLLSSCGPSLTELRDTFPAWTRAAEAACVAHGRCPESSACLAALAAVAQTGAGRKEVAAAYSACSSFTGGGK